MSELSFKNRIDYSAVTFMTATWQNRMQKSCHIQRLFLLTLYMFIHTHTHTHTYTHTHSDQLADQMETVSIKTEGETADLARLDFRARISLAMLLDPTHEGRDWRSVHHLPAHKLSLSFSLSHLL